MKRLSLKPLSLKPHFGWALSLVFSFLVGSLYEVKASGVDLTVYYGSRYVALGGQQIALATDAYSPFYNPAGMAFSTETQTALNLSNFMFQFEAPIGADDSQKKSKLDYAPLFYLGLTRPLTDRITLGLAVFPTSLQGSRFTSVDIPGLATGKTLGSRLVRIEIAPSLSFKVTDYFSVGVSYRPAYTRFETKSAVFQNPVFGPSYLDTTTSAWDAKTLKFGLHLQKLNNISAGLTYRTQNSITLKGSTNYETLAGAASSRATQRVHVPGQLQLGLAYDITPRWLAAFSYERTFNSVYETDGLDIDDLNTQLAAFGVNTQTKLKWRDGNAYHLGTEYTWTLSGSRTLKTAVGFALDQAITRSDMPIPGVAPDANYYGYCVGTQYSFGSHIMGLAGNFGHYSKRTTSLGPDVASGSVFKGNYSLMATLVTMDYQFRF